MNSTTTTKPDLLSFFKEVRAQTSYLCEPLEVEDFVVQPVKDVSPLKWHLGHTTWFFETFVLKPSVPDYKEFHPKYPYLFNSYYISAGDRWSRETRGQLTRPTVSEIFKYREHVDKHLEEFLSKAEINAELEDIIILGCNHEQQHQELFLYDIKRILGANPLHPVYCSSQKQSASSESPKWLNVSEGIYEIGYEHDGFHFDNEKGYHKVFLHDYAISSGLVTNGEFLAFIKEGGYKNHLLWLSEGWDWVNENAVVSPKYWSQGDGGTWGHYTLAGFEEIDLDDPLCHVSYYEADAFARWKGCRLPTEQEWEVACKKYESQVPEAANFVESNNLRPIQTGGFDFLGNVWEWTSSPYVQYPFYNPPQGALGEYNGKFMVNQMVLRGGSFATPKSHIRSTYRNFFHPHLRWMFAGIRLAMHI